MEQKLTGILFLIGIVVLSIVAVVFTPKVLVFIPILKAATALVLCDGLIGHMQTIYKETLSYTAMTALFSTQKAHEIEIPQVDEVMIELKEIIQYISLILVVFLV